MREPLKTLLEKLGVNHELSPYETQPWVLYDAENKVTCSAEVRMNPGGDELEAEIQLLKDEDEEGGEEGTQDTGGGKQPEQVMWMRAATDNGKEWSPNLLRVKGEDYVNAFHDWEKKGCDFFLAVIGALQMGEMPDIDALAEEHMKDDDIWNTGGRGKIGRKSPKIKPAQLLGLKKPF